MSGLYKPTCPGAVIKDKDGNPVLDPNTGRPKRKKAKTSKWYGWWTDRSGRRHRTPLYRDKAASLKKLAELETNSDREHVGLIAPGDEQLGRPLADHLADWERQLLAKTDRERARNTAAMTAQRARLVLIDHCGCKLIRDIQPSKVLEVIGGFRTNPPSTGNKYKRRKHLTASTLNYYLAACKQFCRWLARPAERRAPINLLDGVEGWQEGLEPDRHVRRALSADEIDWLLRVTPQTGMEFLGLSPTDRQALYLTALATGYRASELAALTPKDFELDGDEPVVVLGGADTKNAKDAAQPMQHDVANLLRQFLAGRGPGPVWPDAGWGWTKRASRMFYADLAAARLGWISEAKSDQERTDREKSDFLKAKSDAGWADFHALRHSFISGLARNGVHPKTAQELARHSSINLTMQHYTHLTLRDKSAAVQGLPPLVPGEKPKKGEKAG